MLILRCAALLFALPLSASCQLSTQQATRPSTALQDAIGGKWVGTLEYRDYSEPAGSTKRVQLPTWLTIQPAPEGTCFDYVYDDGPTKTVTEHHTVLVDLTQRTYKVIDKDSVAESYSISGLDKLNAGRGVLVLTGDGKDANQPAEIRTTLTIRRNLLSWLEEVRPAKTDAPFVFRHRYTFTRAEPPPASATAE